jgi:hypothetical protein
MTCCQAFYYSNNPNIIAHRCCCHQLLQDVVREPYRLRLLNGCNAKALIIYFR